MDHQKYLSDKSKEAKEAGHAWITHGEKRYKIEPVPPHENLGRWFAFTALVNNRGKISVRTLVTKDAYPRFKFYDGPNAYCGYKKIMAIVTEEHPVTLEREN